ncbi:hypoxanthine phosphoribosyltransferase [Algoriphagus sp. NG3]|uniref:hypoxanthine phosphoribosyltransferase n=1 Tax=unclassified Algoriphagus TaxID=2641541 RepID=UPI002A7F04AD|nr:hypoxanthine phosphoribosyltransferase [Algoriphagus sp. NG3]WPR74342.1 hypoxanthine phosphoribosyltransferase [Algoriphagus sp. NG3]
MRIKDKEFQIYLSAEEIAQRLRELGQEMTRDFKDKELIVVGVLNGSFIVLADLCREINLPLTTSFIKISSYSGTESTGKVRGVLGLEENIEGKNILIVEDIIDTGISMDYLIKALSEYKPAKISIATLLHKPSAFQFNYAIDYVGFEIPNKFVVGYGLDYDGLGRNLPDIYQLSTP